MPIQLPTNNFTEIPKPDGSLVRLDKDLTIITATILDLKNQNDQKDGIHTWIRGELYHPTHIQSTNMYLPTYLTNRNLNFTLTTKMRFEVGKEYTFVGHIEQYIFKSGAYSLTLKSSTALTNDFDYDTIEKILIDKKVKSKIVKELLQKYKDSQFEPVNVLIDIRRGRNSYYLSDYTDAIISSIQHAMDTESDNLAEAIVKAELLPYFKNNNTFAKQMYQIYGFESLNKLKENPWALIFDISHLTLNHCDEIAKTLGYDIENDPRRIKVIVKLAFKKAIQNSNYTYIPNDDLNTLYNQYLTSYLTYDEFEKILYKELNSDIIKTRIGYQPNYLFWGEQNIYRGYKELSKNNYNALSDTHFNKICKEVKSENPDFEFTELQEKAIRDSVTQGLFILTGGPGTGKTTTLSSILRAHELHFGYKTTKTKKPIMLLAPTGKAATRMMDQTGRYASTIHRQFLLTHDGSRDIHYVLDQLEENDTRLIVIDEASMLDTNIAGSIFNIILQSKQPLKLILVGDDDQLPSIGPGQILTDLLKYHNGVVRLTEVKRQTGASNIPEFAKMIRDGAFPEKEWFKDKDDIYLIEPESDVDMIKKLRLMLARRKQNYNDLDDFQILTPYVNQSQQAKISGTKNYDTCDIINQYTQEFFNPPYYDESKPNDELLKQLLFEEKNDGSRDNNIKRFVNNGIKINDVRKEGRLFRVNDRVVCNTNISQNIANGSVGTLIQIGRQGSNNIKDWILLVKFDTFSEPIEFEYENWSYLDPAYAITIHKSQGSEYQNVFLTLTRPSRLNDSFLNRNIIYTAVTRAKNMIILIGNHQNFATATLNKQRERKTGLAEMLKAGRELKIKTT